MRRPITVELRDTYHLAWWQRDVAVLLMVVLVFAAVAVLGRPSETGAPKVTGPLQRHGVLQRQLADARYHQQTLELGIREAVRLRRLRELSAELSGRGFGFTAAGISSTSPGSTQLTIGRGSARTDVTARDVVVAPSGLVGRIVEVGELESTAALLTDPAIGVPVVIRPGYGAPESADGNRGTPPGASENGPEGQEGVPPEDTFVRGICTGGREDGLLVLGYLTSDGPVGIGDRVVTSGRGEVYPEGIDVGVVVSEPRLRSGVPREALVQPLVEWRDLQEVLVIHATTTPAGGAPGGPPSS